MSALDHTYALILAGGGGTRLWPKSREKTPKQFLKLVGDETMMQLSAARINQLVPWERIIVITNELYRSEVERQLPNVPKTHILTEPKKRDTALAMLVGALFAKQLDPEAVVINCASDHTLINEAEFVRVMRAAATVANDGQNLVTVGITPTRPATGFGYIRIGQEINRVERDLAVFSVDSFTEKPNAATAQAFISTGKYFWNANMYVWKVATLLEAFQEHNPELYSKTLSLQSTSPTDFNAQLADIYGDAPTISIDYAISEKAKNLVLIPGDFGWNDVGDWRVVYQLGKRTLENNVVMGDNPDTKVLALQSQGNLIHTNGRMIALYGVNDMIVIDTEEILMIVPQSQSQEVKKLVENLKENDQKEYL